MLIRRIEDLDEFGDSIQIVRVSLDNSGSKWTAKIVGYIETSGRFSSNETVANVKEHPEHYLGNLIFASNIKENALEEAKTFKDNLNSRFSDFRFDGKGEDKK